MKTGIRVNGVAPGPIWTPFIVSDSSPHEVATFGQQAPMGRAGQPSEVAPACISTTPQRRRYHQYLVRFVANLDAVIRLYIRIRHLSPTFIDTQMVVHREEDILAF